MSPFRTVCRIVAGFPGLTLTGSGFGLGREEGVGDTGGGEVEGGVVVGGREEEGGEEEGGEAGLGAGGRFTGAARFRLAIGPPREACGRVSTSRERLRGELPASRTGFVPEAGAGPAASGVAGLRDHQCFLAGLSAQAST